MTNTVKQLHELQDEIKQELRNEELKRKLEDRYLKANNLYFDYSLKRSLELKKVDGRNETMLAHWNKERYAQQLVMSEIEAIYKIMFGTELI